MKTITVRCVSDCGGRNLQTRCHGATNLLTKYLNKVTAAKFIVAKISRIHWLCILCWKSVNVKKDTHIRNGISYWIGLDRTLNCKFEGHFPSTQLWSNHNMPSKYSTWPHCCNLKTQPSFLRSANSNGPVMYRSGQPRVYHIFDKSVLEGV